MGDPTRGLYEKFTVRRNDNSPRHDGCKYFVLDLTHDTHSVAALAAYADSCEAEYPLLAADLRRINPPPAACPPQQRGECAPDGLDKVPYRQPLPKTPECTCGGRYLTGNGHKMDCPAACPPPEEEK